MAMTLPAYDEKAIEADPDFSAWLEPPRKDNNPRLFAVSGDIAYKRQLRLKRPNARLVSQDGDL